MNIYQKLQTIRVALQNKNLKKSGNNKFAGYNYYELGDFLPVINQLMLDNGVTSVVTFGETARLTLVNCDKPEETIVFESPMREATLKGAHPIQNLGAVETYSRRYLYMAAFEIVESDVLDATNGSSDQRNVPQQGKPQNTKPPVQQKKSQLSKDTSDRLNNALMSYTKLTNYKMNNVIVQLQNEIGKNIKDFTEKDAEKVLELLAEWQTAFMNELGV